MSLDKPVRAWATKIKNELGLYIMPTERKESVDNVAIHNKSEPFEILIYTPAQIEALVLEAVERGLYYQSEHEARTPAIIVDQLKTEGRI